MDPQECRRVLQYYAHHYPKSSTFAMLTATTLTFATFIVAITARDERAARLHNAKLTSLSSTHDKHTLTQTEAQVAAMIENARNSSWRENLENAVDAHERFVLPNRNFNEGEEVPNYVQRIRERSSEMLMEKEEMRERVNDPRSTRFWR